MQQKSAELDLLLFCHNGLAVFLFGFAQAKKELCGLTIIVPKLDILSNCFVLRQKAAFTGLRFRFGFTSKSLIWPKTKLGSYSISLK